MTEFDNLDDHRRDWMRKKREQIFCHDRSYPGTDDFHPHRKGGWTFFLRLSSQATMSVWDTGFIPSIYIAMFIDMTVQSYHVQQKSLNMTARPISNLQSKDMWPNQPLGYTVQLTSAISVLEINPQNIVLSASVIISHSLLIFSGHQAPCSTYHVLVTRPWFYKPSHELCATVRSIPQGVLYTPCMPFYHTKAAEPLFPPCINQEKTN